MVGHGKRRKTERLTGNLASDVDNETDLRRGGGRRSQQSVKAATGCVDEQCRQTTTMPVSDDVQRQRTTSTMSVNDDQPQDTGTSQRLRL